MADANTRSHIQPIQPRITVEPFVLIPESVDDGVPCGHWPVSIEMAEGSIRLSCAVTSDQGVDLSADDVRKEVIAEITARLNRGNSIKPRQFEYIEDFALASLASIVRSAPVEFVSDPARNDAPSMPRIILSAPDSDGLRDARIETTFGSYNMLSAVGSEATTQPEMIAHVVDHIEHDSGVVAEKFLIDAVRTMPIVSVQAATTSATN